MQMANPNLFMFSILLSKILRANSIEKILKIMYNGTENNVNKANPSTLSP